MLLFRPQQFFCFFLFFLFAMTYWLSSSSIVLEWVSESYRYLSHFASVLLSQQHHILTRNQAWQKHAMSEALFSNCTLTDSIFSHSNSKPLDVYYTWLLHNILLSFLFYLQSHSHLYTDSESSLSSSSFYGRFHEKKFIFMNLTNL